MRILILSQWFNPEPTFKGLSFAKELQKLGHEVEVLTGFPNYPQGELYAGYKICPWQREVMDGIPIIRVALFPSHDTSALKRILNYISFAISAACFGPFLVRKADVMYVYHPPATVALAAVSIRLLRGIPFVYDVNDLWPDTLAATGMLNSPMVLKLIGVWCKWTYRSAHNIAVISRGFAEALKGRGVPEDKLSVISNWAEDSIRASVARQSAQEPGFEGFFNVVFAGNMGKAQALDAVLDSAALLRQRRPAVRFVMIGGGIEVDRLKRKVQEMGLQNVQFMPFRPFAEIGPVLGSADALLVHLKDDPLFAITIPSKTQAYLAAGKPIIMGVRGDAANIISAADAGVACEPENPQSIAAAVERLADMSDEERKKMGRNGREFYDRELSIEIAAKRFSDLLQAAAR